MVIGTDQIHARPQHQPGRGVTGALAWLDRKTLPEPDTTGDFDGPAYLAVGLGAAIEGLTLQGPIGALTNTTAALSAKWVETRTGNGWLTVGTGMAVGAALAAVTFPAAGTTGVAVNAALGGLMGAYQAFGGCATADVRGAGNFATMAAGMMLPGPLKIAGGIAAGGAARFGASAGPWTRAVLAGATGAALGAGLALSGLAPAGVVTTAASVGLASTLGSVAGARFTQFFRNISKDFGSAAEHGLQKLGVTQEPLKPSMRNSLGTLPASIIKEGTTGFIYSDGNLWGLAAGALCTSIQQAVVFMSSKQPEEAAPRPSGPSG